MDQCHSCGASLAPAATWCGQCYAPRGHTQAPATASWVPAATAPAQADPTEQGGYSIMSGDRQQAAARPVMPMVKTRWQKTPTTFGPVGRLVCTFLLLVPLPLLVLSTITVPLAGAVGLGIWVFILMPWALRDIWKAGQLPAG